MSSVESGKSSPPALWSLISLGKCETTAPAISGVERRKENLVAASRVNPRNRPVVIVMPERDTPGKSAKACALPMMIASKWS